MSTCIFCGTADNLNTSFNLTLEDGTKVAVAICDEHAEDATVKTVRAAYQQRQSQIDALVQQAAALGMTLQPAQTKGGLVLMQQAPAPAQPVVQPMPTAPLLEDDGIGVIVSKSKLARPVTSVGGNVNIGDIHASVPSYSSHNLNESIQDKQGNTLDPRLLQGQARVIEVEGRAGMPVAIPNVIRDGTGTTRVRVIKTRDEDLQRRFKSIADASLSDHGPDYRHAYDTSNERKCPVCGGDCTVFNRGQRVPCPKCGGAGVITTPG